MAFKKGQSGNPGGRRAETSGGFNLAQMCKIRTPDCVRFWERLLHDEEAPLRDRLRASELLMDRGHGKAVQAIDVTTRKGADDYSRTELAAIAFGRSETLADDRRGEGKPN
jgi:hypothetical protein